MTFISFCLSKHHIQLGSEALAVFSLPWYIVLLRLLGAAEKSTDTCFYSGLVPPETAKGKYTVPAIHHVPTNTYLIDSAPIARFIESTYPDPAVLLTSELGAEVEAKARSLRGTFLFSVMAREIRILSPRAAVFFRRSREATLGHRLEDLLDDDKEDQSWKEADGSMRAISELMQRNKADGRFILGARPSYADFFIAGNLQCARVIDEGVFQRNVKYRGLQPDL